MSTGPPSASTTFALTGAVAGGLSAVAFAGIHHLLIGPIWFFLSVSFTIVAAVGVTAVFGHRVWHMVPTLVTMTLLTLFLGLNVSVMGMVEIQRSALYLVVLNFALILALAAVYAGVFATLERNSFRSSRSRRPDGAIVPLWLRDDNGSG